MASGRSNMWAAGIVYAITQTNGVSRNRSGFIRDVRFHLDSAVIAAEFGVSKSGMTEKAKAVREELRISDSNEEWFVLSNRDSVYALKTMRGMMSRRR